MHSYSRIPITSVFCTRTFRVTGVSSYHTVQFPFEPIIACPCEWDPSYDLYHHVSACEDKAAQVQKLHRLSISLTPSFVDER